MGIINNIKEYIGWSRLSSSLKAMLLTQATGTLNFYANTVTGSDSNDGLTAGTAKATLVGLRAILPKYSDYPIVLNLRGSFDEDIDPADYKTYAGYAIFDFGVIDCAQLVIDGGTDTTVIADDGGSPWTADISSTTSVGTTGNGWTPDAYMGYWVEILSGAAMGETRTIAANTADTITPSISFKVDPGACTYRISRPTTTIGSTLIPSTGMFINPSMVGSGTCWLQNIYFTGKTAVYVQHNNKTNVGACVMNGSAPVTFYANYCNYVKFGGSTMDPVTFVERNSYVAGAPSASISVLATAGSFVGLTAIDSHSLTTEGVVYALPVAGSISDLLNVYMKIYSKGKITISASNAYTFHGAVKELELSLAAFVYIGPCDISNSSTHGIVVGGSSALGIEGGLTGSGNTGAGIHVKQCSKVFIKSGVTPTVTGTVGDTSLDGTTEASTWAAIVAGANVVDLTGLNFIGVE